MAIQTINIGNRVNDGLGDDLRTAFEKVNANFTDLSNELEITAVNLGAPYGLFKQRVGRELQFKTLLEGSKISFESLTDAIRINNTEPDAFTSITTNAGEITADVDTGTNNLTLQGSLGARNIIVSKTSSNVISINTVLDLKQILLTLDFGTATDDFSNNVTALLAASNMDFGTVYNPGRLQVDLGGV